MQEKNLWAPWRYNYIKNLDPNHTPPTDQGPKSSSGCFLCDLFDESVSEEYLRAQHVLVRDERGILLLNRYPYTNGHLLIAPREHVADPTQLSEESYLGMMRLTQLGMKLLRHTLNPQGMNVGINVGRCAGAGLPGHVHTHIVPRWNGDTNFMSIMGHVRVVPQSLDSSYEILREALKEIQET